MAESLSNQQQKRLKAVDNAFRASLASVHSDWQSAYAAILRENNLPVDYSPSYYLTLPAGVHEQVEEAKKAYVAGVLLAQQARTSAASSHPRLRTR